MTGGEWRVVRRVPNPWGQIAMTAGGRSLTPALEAYRDRLLGEQYRADPPSRRHHYVPQTYLRQWSFDGKRLHALNTRTGIVKPIGLTSACVEENFNRVIGPSGEAHNRVELLFGVVDTELRRVQQRFLALRDPDSLEFDDLLALGLTVAVQRMRTLQQRRLRQQQSAWLVAQNSKDFTMLADTPENPHLVAGAHTKAMFDSMWEAADVMTTRQIEVWDDPKGRFVTCDVPVLVPFQSGVRPHLNAVPYIAWPISPSRAVVLMRDPDGTKANMRTATTRMVEQLRADVIRGRELMIFATEEQLPLLPVGRQLARRAQLRARCSQRTPSGEYVEPPKCCVEMSDGYGSRPDIQLCNQGGHFPAPETMQFS